MCKMHRNNKIFTILVILTLLVISLFYYNFIIDNLDHTCSGVGCSICLKLDIIINYFTNFKSIIFVPFLMVILCVFTQLFYVIIETSFSTKETLISLKVELLN